MSLAPAVGGAGVTLNCQSGCPGGELDVSSQFSAFLGARACNLEAVCLFAVRVPVMVEGSLANVRSASVAYSEGGVAIHSCVSGTPISQDWNCN